MAAMATRPAAETAFKGELDHAPDASNKPGNGRRQQLHQDGSPFVMPSKRGIDPSAPEFDPDAFLDLISEDVMFIQHEKLREILEVQADVEYLRRHGLNGRTDVECFRKCVPVVIYSDLEADIMRLVNGEKTSILTVDPITEFNFSSGTTAGKPKYIPGTARSYESLLFHDAFLHSIIRRAIPGFKQGKGLNLWFAGKQIDTPSGTKAGSLTTNYYRGPLFQKHVRNPNQEDSVPNEVILCNDTTQGMYCHLLCALAQAPEIIQVVALFAATVVAAIRALQKQWPLIVEDIRTGTLNEKITEPEMRAAVERTLNPNPELASRIEEACSRENWEGIIPRLFPNAQFVSCIISGTMLQYAPALKHFSSHVPLISPFYAATECRLIGLNIDMKCAPEDITYMLWPESAYYEFIPLNDGGHEQNGESMQILEVGDLEVGKDYELVVTNSFGVTRWSVVGLVPPPTMYRVGDVLRVKRFRNTVPVFEFVRRKNVVLSVHTDKTDEVELQSVVNKACELLGGTSMELSDYTSTVDVTSLPGRYIIFWEMVDSSNLDYDILQKCANELDGSFNYAYRRWRSGNQIGPLALHIVREGTFNKVMASAVTRGASPGQYKPPRCVNHPQPLELLKGGIVASFHSTITPDPTPSAGFSARQT